MIGMGGIGVILLLASVFTKRMNRLVTEPLDELLQGAGRIRDGNLNEEIAYGRRGRIREGLPDF
ncbi:MAG TPA: hypothetical protein IAB84_03565 [Candidatus Choladousia intestinigallinarum]|nr:hypothetical protein [Candidatus Choladousia intestinigallinarum]